MVRRRAKSRFLASTRWTSMRRRTPQTFKRGRRSIDCRRMGKPANTLYYGDNLDILRRYIDDESVDLIYLDPPFNSNADYNVLFAEKDGTQAHAQITAFEDTWEWGLEAEQEYAEILRSGHDRIAKAVKGMRDFIGASDMLAYLVMMGLGLIELRRVLKPTGSIYLHCDPSTRSGARGSAVYDVKAISSSSDPYCIQ